MSPSVEVTINVDTETFQQCLRALSNLQKGLGKKVLNKALREETKDVLASVKTTVPRDTGKLAKSLRVRAAKRKRDRVGFVIQTGADDNLYKGDQFYGAFLNFGTKHIKALHWMEEGFDKVQGSIVTELENKIWSGIAGMWIAK